MVRRVSVVKMWGYRYKDSFGQNEILGVKNERKTDSEAVMEVPAGPWR
jgi:hypothetical protein